jgi:hypothetical protein
LLHAGGAALSAFVWWAWNGYRFWQLQRRGVHVNARLTGKGTAHHARGTAYRLHYQFETADGRGWSGTGSVGWADRKEWQASQETVEVA